MNHGGRRERANTQSVSEFANVASGSTSGAVEQSSSPTFTAPSESGATSVHSYVVEVDKLIDQFRAGERTRFEVVSSITQFLNADTELSPQERTQSFELYMAEVGSIKDTPRDKGKERTSSSSKGLGFHESNLVGEGDGNNERDESSGGTSPSSSDSEGGGPKKRRKLRQSDMPWSRRTEGSVPQNPSCIKSANLIRKFSCNIKSAKLFIKLAPGAPRGIPMSEWEHIFKGEAVDLDKILSSFHRVSVDAERKASVGDTEISISSIVL